MSKKSLFTWFCIQTICNGFVSGPFQGKLKALVDCINAKYHKAVKQNTNEGKTMQTVQYISMQYDDEGAKNVSEMSPSPLFAAINLVTKATTVTPVQFHLSV